jgi:hypothetical protein
VWLRLLFLGGIEGRSRLAFSLVAKQALSERSEDILFSDRQPAEGFAGRCDSSKEIASTESDENND